MFDGRWEAQFTVPSSVSISVTNNGGGPTVVNIAAGTYTISSFVAYLETALTAQRAPSAGAWSVTLSTGVNGTGRVTIAMSAGTFSITWTSTALRDLLGFTANITTQASSTGANQAKGLWRPDAVLRCNVDARRAPLASDHRTTVTPTGGVYALKSSTMYRHANPRYTHVPVDRVWEADALLVNASYETFVMDTQLQEGHAWFGLSALLVIYDHTGTLVGVDANGGTGVAGWRIPELPGLDTLQMSQGIENGIYYRIEWPELLSTG